MECPYCYSTNDSTVYIVNLTRDSYYVYCDECGLHGPTKYSEEEAIEAWNELVNKQDMNNAVKSVSNKLKELEIKIKTSL